jgi:2-hydroxychromene-2-carboxylate isomerase
MCCVPFERKPQARPPQFNRTTVDFFFGPGSRYSYLAATQLDQLGALVGADFRWRVTLGSDLAALAGARSPPSEVGQYTPEYRSRDVARWAALYHVSLADFDAAAVDWPLVVLACAAAELLGHGEAFARAFMVGCHERGAPVSTLEGLSDIAESLGVGRDAFKAQVASPATEERRRANLADAAAAGAFGVPSFVTEDGELFWGQDRIPLLRAYLDARDD